MGWAFLAVIGGLTALILCRVCIARPLWSFVGAALMLGAAGYALQGSPTLPSHPVEAYAEPIEVDPGLVELRDGMLGRFTGDGAYLVAADGLTRSGDTRTAVEAVLGGLAKYPNSVTLWTGLGSALAQHDGAVSPAALFAFRHAAHLSPRQPAPPFFLGLAYVRAGQYAVARPFWAHALALTPPALSYRPMIAERLKALDEYLAAVDRIQAAGQQQGQ